MHSLQKTGLVTGASTGIGRAIVEVLINDGWRIFGSVRKEQDGAKLRDGLGENFTPLIFDVTDDEAISKAAKSVRTSLNGRTLNALINNAGIAVGGPLRYLPLDDLKHQMDVNLYGVFRVTQAFLPMLGADKSFAGAPGKIINMSSVAGKLASPIMGPYAMSKHALEAYSDSLRRELLMHGIDVVVIGPGAITTPIWDKADDVNAEQYKQTEYYETLLGMRQKMQEFGADGLPPEAVGALALDILNGKKRSARYAILKDKLTNWLLPRLLQSALSTRLSSSDLGSQKT